MGCLSWNIEKKYDRDISRARCNCKGLWGLVTHICACELGHHHYRDVIMSTMVSQITDILIVYSTFCLGADQIKHQSSASLAFMRGIHRWPVNSPHKGPVTPKMFPFDDVIMIVGYWLITCLVPSHYLNRSWILVIWTPWTKCNKLSQW